MAFAVGVLIEGVLGLSVAPLEEAINDRFGFGEARFETIFGGAVAQVPLVAKEPADEGHGLSRALGNRS